MLPPQERHDLLAIFAHAPMAVALLREPDHQLDYWNDLFTEFFPGAQLGLPLTEALPALATPQVLAHLDRLYQNGEAYRGTVEQLPGPGAPRYVTMGWSSKNGQCTKINWIGSRVRIGAGSGSQAQSAAGRD